MGTRAWFLAFAVACLLGACSPLAAADRSRPEDIEGLEAWYKAESLRSELHNGDPVSSWRDETANGHDLKNDQNGEPALFNDSQVNGLPAVRVRAGNTYSVTKPFDLAYHTIFIVYKAGLNDRAFFRSDTQPSNGVILRAAGERHQYQNGGNRADQLKSYSEAAKLAGSYTITVLGRDSEKLKAFINGTEVSSNLGFEGPIRVGKFFHVRHTQFARSDGNGLWIAEMLFYKRYLTEPERDAVTGYLSERYGIQAAMTTTPVEQAVAPTEKPEATRAFGLAQLSTTTDANVNDALVPIAWNIQDELDSPFRHDAKKDNTRLFCTRNRTRVRLYVSLPLTSTVAGANVRVLFLKNGAQYLRGEGLTGSFGRAGGHSRSSVSHDVVTTLNAGDYVEVITVREGAPGRVVIDPEMAVFIAEVR